MLNGMMIGNILCWDLGLVIVVGGLMWVVVFLVCV